MWLTVTSSLNRTDLSISILTQYLVELDPKRQPKPYVVVL